MPYHRHTTTRASMAIPTQLSRKLREALGPEAGDDLVTWMHEMRAQHDEMRAFIRADFAESRHEMLAAIQGSESRVREHLHTVLITLGNGINAVESRLNERIGKVEVRVAEVKSDLMKWSFVFWVSAVGAIAALAGVLRP